MTIEIIGYMFQNRMQYFFNIKSRYKNEYLLRKCSKSMDYIQTKVGQTEKLVYYFTLDTMLEKEQPLSIKTYFFVMELVYKNSNHRDIHSEQIEVVYIILS